MTNLATLLVEAAVRFPRRSAFRLRETVLTYAELDELSAHVAGGLSAHGVRVGDRVGTMVPYASAFPLLHFGALRIGAVVLPLYPPTPSAAARPRGAARGARLVFTSHDAAEAADVEMSDTTVVPVGPGFLAQLGFWPQAHDVVDRADDDAAVLVPAGGPGDGWGGMALSHGTLREHATVAARRTKEPTSGPGASESPCTGQSHGLNAVILAGASLAVGEAVTTGAVSHDLPGYAAAATALTE
ncbi:AMP-binding protein [Streptomyces sp. NPDC057362]|uniref:AMP-binding protein n=1 Tax=Streptomyces sp. NPDC057362 TaxID=3346106 RepID=UPI003632063C